MGMTPNMERLVGIFTLISCTYVLGLLTFMFLNFLVSKAFDKKSQDIGQPEYGVRKPPPASTTTSSSSHEENEDETKIWPVIIVGAGAAGLACAQQLLHENNVQCLILESGQCCGNSWKGRYKRLHLHTTKKISYLPGLQMPGKRSCNSFLFYLLYAFMHKLLFPVSLFI
jgi:hypothetical protein